MKMNKEEIVKLQQNWSLFQLKTKVFKGLEIINQ
jgi:hypothetical protein